ncbi:MAG: efflux transporter outer membrane subunit [Betaproteobacteria bacterium]|nr:efflux transporter outer membrane subunit [Betaproteobacteria bacterium]
MNARALLAGVAAALVAAGCVSTEGLRTHATLTDPAKLQATRSLAGARFSPDAWPGADWWKSLGDPQLDALIGEALADSPSIRLARARVERANALAEAAGAPRRPQVNAAANPTDQRFSENFIYPPPYGGKWYWQNQATLNFSYDFDFWGKNAAVYAAALGEAKAAEADAYAARLVLSSAIARAYVQLAHGFDLLDLARDTLAMREKVLVLVRHRVAAGIDSRVELKQAEAEIPAAREQIAQIEETIALTRNQLAALGGEGPDGGLKIARPRLAAPQGALLPSRLPADLIGRRPDVIASRWRVEAAARDIDAARARFYPDVNLAAFVGLQSLGWSKFLESGSGIAGVGPALSLPVFDGGALRGNLGARNADYDAAVEQYNQTLADALREVADQLAAFRAVEQQRPQVTEGLAAAREAYDLALVRYKSGLSNLLSVLSAESQVIAQRSLVADLRARELDASINLAHALGGGYRGEPPLATRGPE